MKIISWILFLSLFFASTGETSIVFAENSEYYSTKSLRNDYRIADVVAYVNVKEKILADHTNGADCDNNKGIGYCSYRLVAELLELYKGEVKSKVIEFYAGCDATYPKKNFLGEKVIFLILNESEEGKPGSLGSLENSSRTIQHDLLQKMRTIVTPTDLIDENDESHPYSNVSVRENFNEADVVVLADVVTFSKYTDEPGGEPFILTARVKEIFKGNLTNGQIIHYKDDLLYRPMRKSDLGLQVLYLRSVKPSPEYKEIEKRDNGKLVESVQQTNPKQISFERLNYTEGSLVYNILEKLRSMHDESQTK